MFGVMIGWIGVMWYVIVFGVWLGIVLICGCWSWIWWFRVFGKVIFEFCVIGGEDVVGIILSIGLNYGS